MTCTMSNTLNLTDQRIAEMFLYGYFDDLLITTVMPIITAIGIIVNLAFLLTIMRLRRMKKSLNAFLGNLAMSDIFFLSVACFIYLITYTNSPIIFNMPITSSLGCVVINVPFYFGHLASLGFITLISVERYHAICQPLRHRVIRTRKRTISLILLTWFVAFGVALFFIPVYSKIKEWCVIWPGTESFQNMPEFYTHCIPMDFEFVVRPEHVELLLIIVFFVVLIINIALHSMIITTLMQRSESLTNQQQQRNASDPNRNQNRKVSIILAVNTLIYFFCQAPYRLHALDVVFLQLFNFPLFHFNQGNNTLWLLGEVFMFLNSAINPIVFVIGSQFYRRAFRDAFRLPSTHCIGKGFRRQFIRRNNESSSSGTRPSSCLSRSSGRSSSQPIQV